jgi:hypothetical protein
MALGIELPIQRVHNSTHSEDRRLGLISAVEVIIRS